MSRRFELSVTPRKMSVKLEVYDSLTSLTFFFPECLSCRASTVDKFVASNLEMDFACDLGCGLSSPRLFVGFDFQDCGLSFLRCYLVHNFVSVMRGLGDDGSINGI